MTETIRSLPREIPEEFRTLFLHKLRHDLINTARPMVEIPKWIEEDIESEGIEIPDSVRENLDMLGNYGSRLLSMILDLLTYAHIGQHPDSDPAPLSEIIAEIAPEILPKTFELVTAIEHDQLPVPKADTVTLLAAILSNAIKHHDRDIGKIRITCKKVDQATQLTVLDDGPGIEPKFIDRIFDPLTTLASRDQLEGSGMGLAIAHRIAEMNGGRVRALSSAGKRGTCIVVWFH